MPWNGSSSQLQVSANQSDGPPRAATKSICFTREGPWVYKGPSGRSKWKSRSICFTRNGLGYIGVSIRESAVIDKNKLVQAVDRIPELRGAGIAYIGDGQCTLIRETDHQSGLDTYVVFQKVEGNGLSTQTAPKTNQGQLASTVGAELGKAALECGGVVLSAFFAGGAAVTIPVTAGFSSVGLALASSALVATSLSCGMSVGRLWNAGASPDANRILDNSQWYSVTGTVIEAIDVADAAHSGFVLIGKYKALRRATSKPIAELLKGANREERKGIAQEMAKFTGEAPTRKSFIRLVRQGKLSRLYEAKQIRTEIAKGLLEALDDATTITKSVLPGRQGEKSGVVYELAVSIVQEN